MGNGGSGEGTTSRCASCGTTLDAGRCPVCQPKDEAKRKSSEALAYVLSQIEAGARRGADLSKVEDLFTAAKFMHEAGDYEDALRILGECSTLAGDIIIQYETLVSAMKRTARKIKDAQDAGVDASDAMRYFEMAEGALRKTDYKRGIAYAMKSSELLDATKKQ